MESFLPGRLSKEVSPPKGKLITDEEDRIVLFITDNFPHFKLMKKCTIEFYISTVTLGRTIIDVANT